MCVTRPTTYAPCRLSGFSLRSETRPGIPELSVSDTISIQTPHDLRPFLEKTEIMHQGSRCFWNRLCGNSPSSPVLPSSRRRRDGPGEGSLPGARWGCPSQVEKGSLSAECPGQPPPVSPQISLQAPHSRHPGGRARHQGTHGWASPDLHASSLTYKSHYHRCSEGGIKCKVTQS